MFPALVSGLPRPDPPGLLPPPVCLLTVAHARRSASFFETPRFSYPSSMWSAIRSCLFVYFDLSPRPMSQLRLRSLAWRAKCGPGSFVFRDSLHGPQAVVRCLTDAERRSILNHMVYHQTPLDATFAALAHPVRREILSRLASGAKTVGELAARFDMSLPAAS